MTDWQYVRYLELRRRTQWLDPATRAAARWSVHGPRWMPGALRRVPLVLCAWVLQFELWRMRHGL